jgi:hypothetical protein
MSIPIPMLFETHMKLRVKFGLCILFSCGLFIITAASIRVALIVKNTLESALLSASWAVRETFVSVIVTNLPVIFPLFKRWLGPLVGFLSAHFPSYQRRSEPTTERPLEGNSASIGVVSFGSLGRQRTPGPNTLYPITHILGQEEDLGVSQLPESSHP